MKCPVCGKYDFSEESSFDICEICGWENDGVQADNHSFAGGANNLSVNEARIEFFLLNKKSVHGIVITCKQRFEEACQKIQKRYAGLNYMKEPRKAKQCEEELKKVRQKYLSDLNDILKNIGNDTIQNPG